MSVPRERPSIDLFTVNLTFPKSTESRKARTLYQDKLQTWLEEEKASMSFEKMIPSKSQIRLESKDLIFSVDFSQKTMIMILGTRNPLQNMEKLNEISNKIFSYLNTIISQEVKEIKVSVDFIVNKKGEIDFSKKVIGDARIARIAEIMKISWNPTAIVFDWKEGIRDNYAMVGKIKSREFFYFTSNFKWQNGLLIDAMLVEKNELLKFEEMVKKVWKEEL